MRALVFQSRTIQYGRTHGAVGDVEHCRKTFGPAPVSSRAILPGIAFNGGYPG